jgi:hypothetical protein
LLKVKIMPDGNYVHKADWHSCQNKLRTAEEAQAEYQGLAQEKSRHAGGKSRHAALNDLEFFAAHPGYEFRLREHLEDAPISGRFPAGTRPAVIVRLTAKNDDGTPRAVEARAIGIAFPTDTDDDRTTWQQVWPIIIDNGGGADVLVRELRGPYADGESEFLHLWSGPWYSIDPLSPPHPKHSVGWGWWKP